MEGFEATGDARQVAAALWNMYAAMREQGFSEDQAMDIVLTMLTNMAAGGSR